MKLASLILISIILSGCISPEKAEDPGRAMRCTAMENSLKPDVLIAASGSGFGVKTSIDRVNSVTEQNLVALQSIYAQCKIWARKGITDYEFSKRMAEHAGVFSAYKAIDELSESQDKEIKEIENRISTFVNAFEKININLDKKIIETQKEFAMSIANQINHEQSIIAIEERLSKLNFQYEEVHKANRAQFIRENQIANLIIQVEVLEYDLQNVNSKLILLEKSNPSEEKPTKAMSVYFDNFSWDISSNMSALIDNFTNSLQKEVYSFRVIGFADKIGQENSNVLLSKNRAIMVSDYLKNKGFDVKSYNGVGSVSLFGSNDLDNRRVIIEAYPHK